MLVHTVIYGSQGYRYIYRSVKTGVTKMKIDLEPYAHSKLAFENPIFINSAMYQIDQ